MLRQVPGVPLVILRQHYNLSVFALAYIVWIWVELRPLPNMTWRLGSRYHYVIPVFVINYTVCSCLV